MQTSTLDIFTSDQHLFQATLYPADMAGAPTLIFLCALGTPARIYARLARELAQQGINVCIPDWRGIGSSSIRATRDVDFGYYQLLEIDHPALLEALRKRYPAAPVWLGGHSLGGQLSLLAASSAKLSVDGVLLVASGTVHLPCYPSKLRAGIRAVTLLVRLSGSVLGYFPGDRLGFGGREALGVMRDWSHVARTGKYKVAKSAVNYEHALSELKTSIGALTFAGDAWAPANATQALIKKAEKSNQTHWHWSREDTQGYNIDHFSWLKRPELVAPTIAAHIIEISTANARTIERKPG